MAISNTTSKSTKKAAKLASSGRGKKVRNSSGSLFNIVLAVVFICGISLVVYARQSRPAADAAAPQVTDHWHHAYGFYLCDTWFQLDGDAETPGTDEFDGYQRTGIHSHNDGVIHWHAFTSASVGRNATLGVFLDTYNVELSNDSVEFPEEQRGGLPYERETGVFANENTTCEVDGEQQEGTLQVVTWEGIDEQGDGITYIADFDNIALDSDGMVVVIAFVPNDTDVTMPPWAQNLPVLAEIDSGQTAPLLSPASTAEPAPSETVATPDSDEN